MIVTPEIFATALAQMKSDPRNGYLTFYDANEIREGGMTPILERDGKLGVLIWEHDGHVEAASLFNNSGVKGAGIDLLKQVIAQCGVNYVNCFEPLNKIYEELGFHTESQDEWDDQYAPDDWNYAEYGRPAVHFMIR